MTVMEASPLAHFLGTNDTTAQSRNMTKVINLWRKKKLTISTFMLVKCPHTGTNMHAAVTWWYMQRKTGTAQKKKAQKQSHPHIYKVLCMHAPTHTEGQIHGKCTFFLGEAFSYNPNGLQSIPLKFQNQLEKNEVKTIRVTSINDSRWTGT